MRQDALLVSINDRLGGGEGQDIAGLEHEWLDELMEFAQVEAEALQEAGDGPSEMYDVLRD